MKEFVRNMSGAERKAWREWQAWWVGIYALVIAALVGIGSLNKKPTESESAEMAVNARASAAPSEPMRANIATTGTVSRP